MYTVCFYKYNRGTSKATSSDYDEHLREYQSLGNNSKQDTIIMRYATNNTNVIHNENSF